MTLTTLLLILPVIGICFLSRHFYKAYKLSKSIEEWTDGDTKHAIITQSVKMKKQIDMVIKRNKRAKSYPPRSMTPMEKYFYSLVPNLTWWYTEYGTAIMENIYKNYVINEKKKNVAKQSAQQQIPLTEIPKQVRADEQRGLRAV